MATPSVVVETVDDEMASWIPASAGPASSAGKMTMTVLVAPAVSALVGVVSEFIRAIAASISACVLRRAMRCL